MKQIFLILSALQVLGMAAFSAELRGSISDYANGQPLSGVLIRVTDLNLETTSDVRGVYILRDLPVGKHVVVISREGYATYTFEQRIEDVGRSYGRNIELGSSSDTSADETPRFRLPEVQVMATRASSTSPVTFTNLSQEDIQAQNYGQDTPLLLSELPNVSAYSEGGAGAGYSYLRMRGMSQDRVAVQVNGVPLNDAETREVFWVDLPDLAEDLQDMQVQRGVGSSLYGPAAFGGSINLVTRTPGLGDRPLIRAEGTYGTWNTSRAMVQFQSGRIQNRYGVAARFTRQQTDGYRFDSWARLWSYYLSGARFSPTHTTRLIFYGGPEKTHLAYEGVNRDYLEGKITGDKKHDRRFNEFQYPGEIDNFFQPHYELHDDWQLSPRTSLANSVYLFKGDGYYDQWRPGENAAEYFLNTPGTDTLTFDVLRRRNVSETDGGWIPRVTFEHEYGTTIVGGDLRLHEAHHEGTVLWSSIVPENAGPDHHYYDYRIQKTSGSGYVHNLFRITSRLRAMVDGQAIVHSFHLKNDRIWNTYFDHNYAFGTVRGGLHYIVTKGRPTGSVYGNVSSALREPSPRDIYDPQDYHQTPAYAPASGHFAASSTGLKYTGPAPDPESLTDVEFGTEWAWPRANLGLNFYYMPLRNEFVPFGGLDNLGLLVTINAKETLHQGIEFVAGAEPLNGLRITGNAALTDHHFVNHTELSGVDSLGHGIYISRNGNRIALDPLYIANGHVRYTYRAVSGGIVVRSVGRQYIDNSEDKTTAVPAYTLVTLEAGYRYTRIPGIAAADLTVRVNNIFDTEYEAFGYNYPEPRYIVGAPRSVVATLGVEL